MNSLNMILNPSSFTYERLNSLKYKELQKLSVQFHVHKRWAKKQGLIDSLLALSEGTVDKEEKDEQEWRSVEHENFDNKKIKNSGINTKINDSEVKQGTVLKKFDVNLRNKKEEKDEKKKSEIKMLTIPYARVTKRTRAGEACKNDSSPLKMSRKSINIKRSTRLPANKTSLMQSLAFSSVKNSANAQTLAKSQEEKVFQSKLPVRLPFAEQKSKPTDNRQNVKKILRQQISKIVNETHNKKTPLRKSGKLNSNAIQTNGNKSIIATKMPDFGKIHKKQFEQMDSLHEYLKKKEDRIRKLFGTPQPGQHLYNLNKSAPVFHFQSTTATKKEDKENECLKIIPATPLMKKENDSKLVEKEAFKSKLW